MSAMLNSIYHKFDAALVGTTSICSIQFFAEISPQDMQSYFTIVMQGLVGAATLAKITYEIYKDGVENKKGKMD
jgi:hypothetical protein